MIRIKGAEPAAPVYEVTLQEVENGVAVVISTADGETGSMLFTLRHDGTVLRHPYVGAACGMQIDAEGRVAIFDEEVVE